MALFTDAAANGADFLNYPQEQMALHSIYRSDGIALMNKVLAALMTLIIIGTVVVVFGLGFMSLM